MSSKSTVMKAAAALGVRVEEMSSEAVWDVTLEAPHGHRLVSSGCHLAVINENRGPWGKAGFWKSVLEDLRPGVERCDDPTDLDCEARECFVP